jgi:hypothetical protein
MNSEVTLVHDQTSPHARDQLALAYNLTSALDQHHQNIESTIAQCERDAVLFECAGCREQPEWSK